MEFVVKALLAILFGIILFAPMTSVTSPPAWAKEPQLPEQEAYLLRYKLKPDERLNYEVTHMAKTKTRIRGTEETSQVHTISRRHWEVTEVTPSGEMKFDHIVDAVEMTQQAGEEAEIRWDSSGQEEPPIPFQAIAKQIGEKLATVTIDERGEEKSREDFGGTKASLGMGTLTLSLPEKPIKAGDQWSIPREIKTRTPNGEVQLIKIRELYTLEKVQTGVATISVRSEPLTPISEESIKAQVIQQLSNGSLRFDIDHGRMLSKQLDWDETVVGFQGANSMMEYRSRMTEQLIDGVPRTAKATK
jgi:hypothetical protein